MLRPRAADAVAIVTRGEPRAQYRAAGVPGEPLPYEDSASGGLVLCAGLGPLFGPCAGVMIGTLAVAGVTTSLVDGRAGAGGPDAADTAAALAADSTSAGTLAAALGADVTAGAVSELQRQGHEVTLLPATAADDCGLAPAGERGRRADVDIVALELEFEPGYQYRLSVVARVRIAACGEPAGSAGRRLAWRGRLRALARDTGTARRDFEAELAAAVRALGRAVATQVAG